jgi:hypothetical protein
MEWIGYQWSATVPWQYSQRTGQLTWNNQTVATGYSGQGIGLNNPETQQMRNVGPIPRGQYRIGAAHAHPTKGPVTMRLDPVGHNALGRSHFLIHGDSRQHPGTASEGCIVLNAEARRRISTSNDVMLNVVE